MIVNFQINNITIQANGDDNAMIKSGILAHLIEIEKLAAIWKETPSIPVVKEPKKDIEDLDYNDDKNPEDEVSNGFDPDRDSIG